MAFDDSDPPGTLAPEHRSLHAARAERVAGLGEPWLSHFEPAELRALLRELGFAEVEDLGPPELASAIAPAPRASRPGAAATWPSPGT